MKSKHGQTIKGLLPERSGRMKKYLALAQDDPSLRPDLEPNIFPSGPLTQLISK